MPTSTTAGCCRSWCATAFAGGSWRRAARSTCVPTCCRMPAAFRNRRSRRSTGATRRAGGSEVSPIYTQADAIASLQSFQPVDYETWIDVIPGVRARYWNAGHLLGSASIELEFDGEGSARPAAAPARLGRYRSRRKAARARSEGAGGLRLRHFGIDLRRPDSRSNDAGSDAVQRLAAEVRDAAARKGRPADPGLRGRTHPGIDRRSGRPDGARRSAGGADLPRFSAGDPRHRGVPQTRREPRPRISTSIGCSTRRISDSPRPSTRARRSRS